MPPPRAMTPSCSAASATGSTVGSGTAPSAVAAASRPPSSSSGMDQERTGATRGAAARGVISTNVVAWPESSRARTVARTTWSDQACGGTAIVIGTLAASPGPSDSSVVSRATVQSGSLVVASRLRSSASAPLFASDRSADTC